ncbi:MAG: response regulator [Planctomycetes bacterium]|nr:response regulator [Planctomycetota bacterium]
METHKPHVLLIDDERATIELMGAVLGTQGFQVTLCHTAREACHLLDTLRFDAVVTDVVFEGRAEGADLLARCREAQPDAVVVLMTGYPAVDAAVSAIKSGATDYLQKPVDPIVLGAMVHKSLRERQLDVGRGRLAFSEMVDIVSGMVANTIERVDPYTAGHGERTRRYCRILGERFGLEQHTLERLELGAIAHDYGKIYLDDLGFLTKQGPLTPEEYREVQRHPELGARMLGDHPHLEDVCKYVAEHHEKWDGSGYPRRLREDEISLPGRILGVVEVFDSLSTKRSYKDVWELPKTLQFFEAQRGRAFDPRVLDEFLALLEVHGEEWIAAPQRDLEAAGVRPPG